MNLLKRALAGILTACTVLTTCTACGEKTGVAMTIDGKDVPAGIYLYYVATAYSDAMDAINSDVADTFKDCETTKDVKKIMKSSMIDNVQASQWIENKAVEYCQAYVAVNKEFDNLKLSLTGNELASIDSAVESSKVYYGQFFKENGIGDKSIKEILTLSYKENAIYDAYYGEDGSEGITDEELRDDYVKNHLRTKYIEMPLKDGEGNLLKSDGKKVIEDMANDFLKRLEKKSGNEAEMMKEFDYLIEENKAYITSVSEAAVTTTDENGQTITTPTTAKVTTMEETTAPGTTVSDENAASATTVVADAGNTTTTTTTAVTDTTGETTAPVTGGTTGGSETTGDTTTTTTAVTPTVGYDVSNEEILSVSTAPAEPTESTETDTVNYTPCEAVYKYLADSATPLLKPTLIKDEEAYYVVMKMDIKDRMTEDDLWTEDIKYNVCYNLYHEKFMDTMTENGKKLSMSRNEKAFNRYNVLDVDVMGYMAATQQSYYDYYMAQQNAYGY